MAQNGEINKRFGVYKNLCCGVEIVLTEGATFPDCPNHPKLTHSENYRRGTFPPRSRSSERQKEEPRPRCVNFEIGRSLISNPRFRNLKLDPSPICNFGFRICDAGFVRFQNCLP